VSLNSTRRKLASDAKVDQNHLVCALAQNQILRLYISVEQTILVYDFEG
jgi:hypothetical protein